MSGLMQEVGDAVVTALNTAEQAAQFAPHSFEAYRPYDLRKDVTKMPVGELDILVKTMEEEETDAGRALVQVVYTIEVGVRVRVADREPETIDPYCILASQIRDLFRRAELTLESGLKVKNISRKILAPWDSASLDQFSVFMSAVRLEFQALRKLV